MTANTSRGSSLNGKSQMINLTGRVNFLDMKNNKIEKNMIECINFFRKSKFPEDKSTKASTNKTSTSSKSHQQFRMTKRNHLKRQDIEKDKQVNQDLLEKRLVLSSQRNQQGDNKFQKTLRGFAQRSIRTQPYPESDVPTNPFVKQRANPLIMCQSHQESKQLKVKSFIRGLTNTNNNFMQENKQTLSTLHKIPLKQKQQRQRKKRQQRLKLIELKRKLLEEEEKSIGEFENCVLYKQRIVDKMRSEQRLKQILNGNALFKLKRQN